jgi:two-component system, chemotaxis family, sensor kinase CheA
VTIDDEELAALFSDELSRHLATLRRDGALVVEILRALHAVRGSAGMMGETDLAETIGRFEQRVREGDAHAVGAAADTVAAAIDAVRAGSPLPTTRWPQPPPDLAASPPPEDLRSLYLAEMRDRIARIDEALAETDDAKVALSAIRRHVHAVKGAASAVGDKVAVWYVHGFESHLRDEAGKDPDQLLEEAARMRGVLAAIVNDPARALSMLRGHGPPSGEPPRSSGPTSLPDSPRLGSSVSAASDSAAPSRRAFDDDLDDGSLRVPSASIDRLVERAQALSAVVAQLGAEEGAPPKGTRELRAAAALIADALRLIGPPRPWGTPAAAIAQLHRAADTVGGVLRSRENETVDNRVLSDRMSRQASQVAADLRALRTTEVSWLFSRVRASILAQASRLGRPLRVVTAGDDLAVDRRVLEQLLDPGLQLAGNALVHGMEPPTQRADANKPEELCLHLEARLRQGLLRVTVSDDGRGVDVERVRERVRSLGLLDDAAADAADPSALLDLLFLPGVSTRREVDEWAGRGIGLDMAATALQSVGASLRLASERGRGVTATLDIPLESGLLPVLWVEAAEHRYGLPVDDVTRVLVDEAGEATPLASLIEGGDWSTKLSILLEPPGHPAFALGVDRVVGIEDVALRRLPGIVLAAGPYLGAVNRPDGGLDLVLDADALAEAVG